MTLRTFPASLLLAAALLLYPAVFVSGSAAGLRLRAERSAIAVLDESGRQVGSFVRPESDLEPSGEEKFTPVSIRADGSSGRMVWRSSLDYEAELTLEAKGPPPRVEARVKVRSLAGPERQVYLYFPFEREGVVEHPWLISFAADGDELLPFEREMPGEGLTAFWGTAEMHLARPDAELLLPVVAAQVPSGFLVAGCDPASAFAIRFHREGRVEFARRFFPGSAGGAGDAAPLSLCTDWNRPYTFFVGVAPEGTRWADIYRDWFLALNPSRLRPGPAGAARAVGRAGPSAGEDAYLICADAGSGGGAALLELPAAVPSGPDARPDPALRDSLILTPGGQPVPWRGGWKANISPRFSLGRKALAALDALDAGRWAGALADTGPDANRVDRNRRLPPYPFFPHHLAAAELLCEARKRIEPRGLLLAARANHPASPALEMAGLITADASSERIAGIRLAAGTRPVAAEGPATPEGWMRALFFGCIPPAERPAGFPDSGVFRALAEAVITGGTARPDRLEFRSASGEIWVTVRNLDSPHSGRPVSFPPQPGRAVSDGSWRVYSWSRLDGLRAHGEADSRTLMELSVTLNLAAGDSGVLFAVPSAVAVQAPYAGLPRPGNPEPVRASGG